MRFCPECGAMLEIVHQSPASLKCRKCGCTMKLKRDASTEKRTMHSYDRGVSEVAVLSREETKLRTFPVVNVKCEKCGKNESESWAIEVGSQGTSAITFFRCTSCGHTRREVA